MHLTLVCTVCRLYCNPFEPSTNPGTVVVTKTTTLSAADLQQLQQAEPQQLLEMQSAQGLRLQRVKVNGHEVCWHWTT